MKQKSQITDPFTRTVEMLHPLSIEALRDAIREGNTAWFKGFALKGKTALKFLDALARTDGPLFIELLATDGVIKSLRNTGDGCTWLRNLLVGAERYYFYPKELLKIFMAKDAVVQIHYETYSYDFVIKSYKSLALEDRQHLLQNSEILFANTFRDDSFCPSMFADLASMPSFSGVLKALGQSGAIEQLCRVRYNHQGYSDQVTDWLDCAKIDQVADVLATVGSVGALIIAGKTEWVFNKLDAMSPDQRASIWTTPHAVSHAVAFGGTGGADKVARSLYTFKPEDRFEAMATHGAVEAFCEKGMARFAFKELEQMPKETFQRALLASGTASALKEAGYWGSVRSLLNDRIVFELVP